MARQHLIHLGQRAQATDLGEQQSCPGVIARKQMQPLLDPARGMARLDLEPHAIAEFSEQGQQGLPFGRAFIGLGLVLMGLWLLTLLRMMRAYTLPGMLSRLMPL